MDLSDLIEAKAILPALRANSKKQVLQLLSEKAARADRSSRARGVSTPSCSASGLARRASATASPFRTASCRGVKKITGVFARLETRLISRRWTTSRSTSSSCLLAPESAGADHLKALSRIARVLRDGDTVDKIRATADAAAIHSFLSETPASHAA
jgi:PTS system nitrogen regulatory IIA component